MKGQWIHWFTQGDIGSHRGRYITTPNEYTVELPGDPVLAVLQMATHETLDDRAFAMLMFREVAFRDAGGVERAIDYGIWSRPDQQAPALAINGVTRIRVRVGGYRVRFAGTLNLYFWEKVT